MYIQNIAQKAFYKRCKKVEDIETQARKASSDNAGVAAAPSTNGRVRNDSASNGGSFDDVEDKKVETGLINPITGLPCPNFDQDDNENDDDDIIFL